MNTKIIELYIEPEELQKAKDHIQQLEMIVQILSRNRESLAMIST